MAIKIIYTFFLALIIAFFVGLGIDSFYPGPKGPDYPTELQAINKDTCQLTTDQKAAQIKYDADQKDYLEKFKVYNQRVSMISIAAAILILILSLTLLSKIKMIADGILLGGVFTTLYSIARAFMTSNSKFSFTIVAVGLLIALVLGYIKFIRPKELGAED